MRKFFSFFPHYAQDPLALFACRPHGVAVHLRDPGKARFLSKMLHILERIASLTVDLLILAEYVFILSRAVLPYKKREVIFVDPRLIVILSSAMVLSPITSLYRCSVLKSNTKIPPGKRNVFTLSKSFIISSSVSR